MKDSDILRFWSKVNKDGPIPSHCPELGPCWIWIGGRWHSSREESQWYGRFKVEGVEVPAHRFAWELRFGPIAEGLLACHRCDNPPCVNYGHLFIGTQKDNIADADAKGRMKRPTWNGCRVELRGSNGPNTKLTEPEARIIKTLLTQGLPQIAIAREMGISKYTVSHIARRQTWNYL